MSHLIRISGFVVLGLCVLLLTACPKPVEQSQPGPGGLPTGIIEGSSSPPTDVEYPAYPGSVELSNNKFETSDFIDEVRDYYADLLGIEPETMDELAEVYTFTTEDYELVLIPIPYESGGGVEINFSPVDRDE